MFGKIISLGISPKKNFFSGNPQKSLLFSITTLEEKNRLPWGTSKRISFFSRTLPKSPSMFEKKNYIPWGSSKKFSFFFQKKPPKSPYILKGKNPQKLQNNLIFFLRTLPKSSSPLWYLQKFFFSGVPQKGKNYKPWGKNPLLWGTSKRFSFFFRTLPKSSSMLEEKITFLEVFPKFLFFFSEHSWKALPCLGKN